MQHLDYKLTNEIVKLHFHVCTLDDGSRSSSYEGNSMQAEVCSTHQVRKPSILLRPSKGKRQDMSRAVWKMVDAVQDPAIRCRLGDAGDVSLSAVLPLNHIHFPREERERETPRRNNTKRESEKKDYENGSGTLLGELL